jgi:hypothetical protein
MRVFVSQPMNGLSDDQVMKTLRDAEEKIRSQYGKEHPDIEVVSTYKQPEPDTEYATVLTHYKNVRLYYLGNSIKILGQCDAIYFCDGWTKANGCQVEYMIANLYNIPILNDVLEV